MKRRYRVLLGIGGALALGIATLMTVTAWDTACPAAAPDASGEATMQAMRHRCYGVPGGLRMERVAKPVPGEGQVLIRVHASSINPADWYGVAGQPYLVRLGGGIGAPKDALPGYDMAGVIEAIGPKVTRFAPGDAVFGGVNGALSEYVLAREQGAIVRKPEELSFEEAAGLPIAAITALQGLRDQGHLAPGQKVLINGASGGVGTYAVQIAKAMGAEVTGVCSTRNVELVRSLGADHVIDYTQQDFTELAARYDLILDNVGNHGYLALARTVTPGGTIVTVGGSKSDPWLGPISRIAWRVVVQPLVEPRLPFYIAQVNSADLEILAQWAREGKLRTPIDRRYALADVGAALEYLGTQRARGKVIIAIGGDETGVVGMR